MNTKLMNINRKTLKRDFIIVNISGISGIIVLFMGMLLKEWRYIPEYQCAFLKTTHMYCPGCGGTRAVFSLLAGNVIKSLCYNPAVVLGALLVLYYEITVIMTICSKKGRVYYCRSPWPVYIYVLIVLIFAVVRDVLLVVFGIDLL